MSSPEPVHSEMQNTRPGSFPRRYNPNPQPIRQDDVIPENSLQGFGWLRGKRGVPSHSPPGLVAAQILTRSPRRRDRDQRSACELARHRKTKGKNVVVS
jgi:hypothetical protein